MRCSAILPLLLLVSALGCSRADSTPSAHAGTPTASASAGLSPSASQPVSQIVFIDKEECCDCTKTRIETSWKALETALGPKHDVQVVRVHLDTQPDLAKEYLRSKPVMVPPGIYFMSQKGDLIEMLQGEVSVEQIAAILTKK